MKKNLHLKTEAKKQENKGACFHFIMSTFMWENIKCIKLE